MAALEKMRNEFIDQCPRNYTGELEAERQKCDTCYHNETEFSICQYCTGGDKYEERYYDKQKVRR